MNLNVGATLKSVEKIFGPALSGRGDPDKTLSAIRYAAGKGKNFAGVSGIVSEAVFYIHFPTSINLAKVITKKVSSDFIKDLKEDGPQAAQGRQAEVEEFLGNLAKRQAETFKVSESRIIKAQEAAFKKQAAQEKKAQEKIRIKENAALKRAGQEKKFKEEEEKAARMKMTGTKKVFLEVDGLRLEVIANIAYSAKKKKFTAKLEWS